MDGMEWDEKESSEPSPRIHLILQIGLRGCEVDHDDDFHPLCIHRRHRCHTIMEPYRSGGQVGLPADLKKKKRKKFKKSFAIIGNGKNAIR